MGWIRLINFRTTMFSFYRCRDRDKVLWIICRADARRVEKGRTAEGAWAGGGDAALLLHAQRMAGGGLSHLFKDDPWFPAAPSLQGRIILGLCGDLFCDCRSTNKRIFWFFWTTSNAFTIACQNKTVCNTNFSGDVVVLLIRSRL